VLHLLVLDKDQHHHADEGEQGSQLTHIHGHHDTGDGGGSVFQRSG
jgi:hypothetical protein